MLVIGAIEDQLTPAKMARKIAQKYQAEYRVYSGFAHMLILEPGWEQIAKDIADWLESAIQTGSKRPKGT